MSTKSKEEWISVDIVPNIPFARLKWKYSDDSVDYGVWMKGEFCTMDACRELQITHYQILSDAPMTRDEYARQTAIGFAEWKDKNYMLYEGDYINSDSSADDTCYTLDAIFAIYLIHLQSPNK